MLNFEKNYYNSGRRRRAVVDWFQQHSGRVISRVWRVWKKWGRVNISARMKIN